VAAIGQTLVIFTGGIDLSVVALIGTTGIIVGMGSWAGVGTFPLILIGAGGRTDNLRDQRAFNRVYQYSAIYYHLGTRGDMHGGFLVLSQGKRFHFSENFDWMGTENIGPYSLLTTDNDCHFICWVGFFSTKTRSGR
jgi:ribose/xylose/arabinose/galactoside ABC-type transport system permease subunit